MKLFNIQEPKTIRHHRTKFSRHGDPKSLGATVQNLDATETHNY